MKKYSIYCLSLLFAVPLGSYARYEEGDTIQSRRLPKTVKKEETRTVTGRVVVSYGSAPLAGVLVRATAIEGYSTLTAEDGSFALNVPLYASNIEFSSPGYNLVRVGIGKQDMLGDVVLHTDAGRGLYGDDDNIMGTVSASGFDYSSAFNITTEIGNRLGADVHTVTRSGTPGIGSFLTIGGLNSLSSNAQPLIVVDGVILEQQYGREMLHSGFYNDILNSINVHDIEKVEVMKNGTALYGAKGSNGVILIQTKRNKSLATRIDATISGGIELVPKMYSLMNGTQFKTYASELLRSTGTNATSFRFLNPNPDYYYYNKYNNNTDWADLIYREAFSQNYGISVQGGGEVANYMLSLGYTSVQSTLKENDVDRLNIRFNTDIKLSSHLGLRFDASFSNQTRSLQDEGAPSDYDNKTVTSTNYLALVKSPMLSPYSYASGQISSRHYDIVDEDYLDEALSSLGNINYRLANPLCINEYGTAENKNYFENSFVNIAVTPKWKINKHLSLQSLFSYTLVNTNETYYVPLNGVPSYYVQALQATMENEIQSLYSKQNSLLSDTKLAWDNRYGAHTVCLMGGFRYMNESYSLNQQKGYNTGNDKTPYINNCLFKNSTGANDSWATLDWYAQAQYNYKQRYFLQGDLSLSTSSLFGREANDGLKMCGVVWGVFPSIQAGWVVSNEKWFRLKGLDYMKLTIGYGVSGNDNIGFDASRSYFQSNLYLNKVPALSLTNIGNTELQWETTKRFNAGVELNAIHNRLGVKFNYFLSKTDNLLTYKELNMITGLDRNWSNGGSLENQGFDVSLNARLISRNNWNWELGASVGHYVNKLTKLPDGKDYIDTELYGGIVRSQVGAPISQFYGYLTGVTQSGTCVYATTEEAKADGLYFLGENGTDRYEFGAGDVKFVDLNGDGRIDENDRTVIGDPNPDIFGNIFTSLSYKRIRLDVGFNYSVGGDVYNYVRAQLESGSRFMNQSSAMLGRWTAEGQRAELPKATFGDPMGNSRFSDRWIEDGSYLRLRHVTLSYKLPINNTYIQGITVWGQANNLFTLTKYLGTDPEFSMGNSVLEQGIDRGLLAQGRSFYLGVKINL